VAERQEGLDVKFLGLLPILTASKMIRQTSVKHFHIKFYENEISSSHDVTCRQKDGHTQRGY
jgi:hypothetical protein